MQAKKQTFGVRLMGFPPAETAQITAALAQAPMGGPVYSCLLDASLQEPDFYIGNGDNVKAIADLVTLSPGALQPALVIGQAPADVEFPQLPRPIDPQHLCARMAKLAKDRAMAVARLGRRSPPVLPQRRRALRLDLDLTDPAEYEARRREPPAGAILILDQRGALRDHVARLLGTHRRAVEWTDSPIAAYRLCEETPVSLVLINTSMPNLDPYEVCARIKAAPEAERIAVILLVGPTSPYDPVRGSQAGVRGILDKPVADRHMVATLRCLLSMID